MMICKPGDVVDIPFPFIDSSSKKVRPALVLSNEQFQLSSGACILVMLTSAERSHWDCDIELEDWQAVGLKKPTILRWKVFTLDEQHIQSFRGSLSSKDNKKVQKAFQRLFPGWIAE